MRSIKIRLEPNNKQRTAFLQHAGTARHAYNWGLALSKRLYEEGEKRPSAFTLHKLLVKDVKSVNPWYYESSKCAPQQALTDLDTAYKNFFRKHKQLKAAGKPILDKKGNLLHYPSFKKRGKHDSFYFQGAIRIENKKIKLPRIGWVRISEDLELSGIKNCVVSRTADHWFVAFKLENIPAPTEKTKDCVGVDIGIKTLATLSDGTVYKNVRAFKRYKKRLKREQRKLSRRFVKGQPQSNNYHKQKKKVANLHYKIACLRKDAIHKLTSDLAKNHSQIVIEDLNVQGMSKNKRLANAVLDSGFYEFRRQLEYKTNWYGSELIVADRFFPSSKTCSCCGKKKEKLTLSTRTFRCECGHIMDRDLNAAVNLKKLAVSSIVSGGNTEACGVLNKPEAA